MTEKVEPTEKTEMAESPDTMANLRTILGEGRRSGGGRYRTDRKRAHRLLSLHS
jgi:hypothetical protein